MKKKRYSKSTFMSSIISFVGFLEIVFAVFVILGGIGVMTVPIEEQDSIELFRFLGISMSIVLIGSGAILFFNGALFIALSQSVGFSKQNNLMLKDLISK